jgi:hypothetical protein
METPMLTALDLYLATASCTELVAFASAGILTVGLGPWFVADLIQHISAARRVSQGVR